MIMVHLLVGSRDSYLPVLQGLSHFAPAQVWQVPLSKTSGFFVPNFRGEQLVGGEQNVRVPVRDALNLTALSSFLQTERCSIPAVKSLMSQHSPVPNAFTGT